MQPSVINQYNLHQEQDTCKETQPSGIIPEATMLQQVAPYLIYPIGPTLLFWGDGMFLHSVVDLADFYQTASLQTLEWTLFK